MSRPSADSEETRRRLPRESLRQIARELAPLIIDELQQLGILQGAAIDMQDNERFPPCKSENRSTAHTDTATDGVSKSISATARDARDVVEHLRRRTTQKPSEKP